MEVQLLGASGAPMPTQQQLSGPGSNTSLAAPGSSASSSPLTSPDLADAQAVPLSSGRTKTSHTTIERRYRTNLNARIQALRNAVPALRVLEQKDGNRVGNLAIKSGSSSKIVNGIEEVDVVDERGYIDGVKVARKGSKANVLGKAVEYIKFVFSLRYHELN